MTPADKVEYERRLAVKAERERYIAHLREGDSTWNGSAVEGTWSRRQRQPKSRGGRRR